MLPKSHLALRLVRLKPTETWDNPERGLFFVFPKVGTGEYDWGMVTRRLAIGEVLAVNTATAGGLRLRARTEMVFWFFCVSLEQLIPLFPVDELWRAQSLMNIFNTPRLYASSSVGAQYWHKLISRIPSEVTIEHRGQVLTVAGSVLSEEIKYATSSRSAYVSADERISLIFEQLSLSEILDLSVEELATRFGCSTRHLNRVFQRRFGLCLRTLRMEMRLLKATFLLRDPESKVISVAGQCGFNHLGRFNTCFRRRFGVTPGKWRKNPDANTSAQVQSISEANCQLRNNGLCPWCGGLAPLYAGKS